jgi:hypothetical protein
MSLKLKKDAPSRNVTQVGRGDYIKVNGRWEQITSNSAFGAERPPRSWTVRTEAGNSYDLYHIDLYAKAEDLE